MKTPQLRYFKRNTAELPDGYRKPIKRRRKLVVLECQPIVVPKPKPVIRRRTPRGRLMPLRMKNEWIPRSADWCQINGQKVRQDIFFGEVVGRVFIPGLFTGEACGSCGPSMLDFGGGCGDGGCGDGGCEGCGGESCGGCESCASSACETGCQTGGETGGGETGCESAGCESTGCAVDGCAGCGGDTGCDTGGPTGGGGCDTGCTGCAGEGCGQSASEGGQGCEAAGGCGGCDTGCAPSSDGCGGCESAGCDTGCGMGCDAGCAAACADTGCGMGCVAPASDFGGWGPTAGVDTYSGGPGWGVGPADTGNWGQGGAMGPPGWGTGDFGPYGSGGPTGTGFGPGAPGATIGGPGVYAQSPGITGFPGDFGAPPGGAFGMPLSQGDVGPQVGPGMPGGPGYVGNAEPSLTPGILQGDPGAPPTVNPDDRSETTPASVFGPEFASNQAAPTVGNFGVIGQAQAADRGTDALAIALQSSPFAQVQAMAEQVAQSNPALAEALMGIAANQNVQTNMIGPMMTGLEGATPGAQQGFTGVGPTASSSNAFTGQPSLSGVSPFGNESAQGKGDRGDTTSPYQMGNAGIIGTVDAMTAAQQAQAQQQAAMFDAQALGEQGRGQTQAADRGDTFASRFDAVTTPQQTINDAFDTLTGKQSETLSPQQAITDAFEQIAASNQQQAMQQAQMFDQQALGEQGRAGRVGDTFDSRFGDWTTPTTRGSPDDPDVPPAENQTIALGRGQDVISSLNPATRGAGGGIGLPGLLSMYSQPAGRPGTTPGGRSGQTGASPFGRPGGGNQGGGRPGLSITVGGRPSGGPQGAARGSPGYYLTGGPGIAPGARGAEYGGIYGPGVATGRPGTNTFGIDSRSGAYGYFDPYTGQYYR